MRRVMRKVYCYECESVVVGENKESGCYKFFCEHPKNCIIKKEGNWYSRRCSMSYKSTPQKLNKNNNCKYYKKRT